MAEDWDGRYQQVARLQYTEIERLHAELAALRTENRRLVDWIMGDEPDALTYLQRTYSDPNASEARRDKCAIGALPFERSKPASASVVIVEDWAAKTKAIRLRQEAKDRARWAAEDAAKVIEHQPDPEPAA
jgi:hypothetical protein